MTFPVQGVLAVAPAGPLTAAMSIALYSPGTVMIAPVVQAYVAASDPVPANTPETIVAPQAPVLIRPPGSELFPPQAPVLP